MIAVNPERTVGLMHGVTSGLINIPIVPVTTPLQERGNLDLLELYQQMAVRVDRYDNEAQFNALQEIRAELERRLEIRSPDLRDKSIQVGTVEMLSDGEMFLHQGKHDLSMIDPETPVFIGRAASPNEASFEVQRLRNLILKSHPHVPNKRCRAYEPREGDRPPGPGSPPMFCTQQEGHAGPHRNQHGAHLRTPFKFFRSLPGHCRKCNAPWPCATVREAGIDLDPALEAELIAGQGGR